jgi:hypothetical protein
MDRPAVAKIEADTNEVSSASSPRDWVHELIAMTRPGLDMELPDRAYIHRPPPFVFDDFD